MAKDFTKVTKALDSTVREIVSQAFLKVLAEKARQIIYRRTKSGKGVNPSSGSEQTLKALSPRYIEYRKGNFSFTTKKKGKKVTANAKKPRLGEFGSPSKSNLTLTGEMLDSIQIKIQKYGFLLYFPNTKHKWSKRVTVRQLAQYVQENGRPFFSLSQGEIRVLLKAVQDDVRKQLRRI